MDATTSGIADLLRRPIYRPDELAELLGMDVEVIRQAVFAGELPATRAGRDIVCIARSDVLDWLRG